MWARLKQIVKQIVNDTLKRSDGRWSRTSLTWLTSFLIANSMALYDVYTNGFNITVFTIYIGYVFGTKWLETQNKTI